MMRRLDLGNMSEGEMVRGLVRIILELKASGTPELVLRKAVRRMIPVAWCPMHEVKGALGWTEEQRKSWVVEYDAAVEYEFVMAKLVEALRGGPY